MGYRNTKNPAAHFFVLLLSSFSSANRERRVSIFRVLAKILARSFSGNSLERTEEKNYHRCIKWPLWSYFFAATTSAVTIFL